MIQKLPQYKPAWNFPAVAEEAQDNKGSSGRMIPILLSECALILWVISLFPVDISAMNDYGLASVLPSGAYMALLLLMVSFCITLKKRYFDGLTISVQFLCLIFMLYGLTALVEPNPRFHVAWRHIGIIEYIQRTHTIDPYINVYFNWPGFFVLFTVLFDVAGMKNPVVLMQWMPVILNLLYFGPLYMIFAAGTDDRRVIWLAMWLFYIANWIGQDYFAPQGLTLFGYLVIIGIVLQGFRGNTVGLAYIPLSWLKSIRVDRLLNWLNRRLVIDQPHHNHASADQRAVMVAAIILIFAAVVPSHQLTPMFTIIALSLLVLLNRTTLREMPVLMAIMNVMWILLFAAVYLNGHIDKAVGGIGEVGENVTINVIKRLNGSPDHLLVVRVRLFMTVAIGLLGMMGALRRLRIGKVDLSYVLLIIAPFSLVLVQPYGGEMVLRAYLFALAPMAFMAATLFYPSHESGQSWKTLIAVGTVTLLLGGGFLLSRYGNERMDYYTDLEVAAVDALYDLAEPGSLLVVGSDNVPWKSHSIEQFRYKVATPASQEADIERFLELMTNPRQPNAYYLVTRSQKAYSELFLGDAPGTWDRTEQALLDSGLFKIVYENPDARIFTLLDRNLYISEHTDGYSN